VHAVVNMARRPTHWLGRIPRMKMIEKALVYVIEHEDQARKFVMRMTVTIVAYALLLFGYIAYAYFTGTLGQVR
jgi:hypothetical protein